MLEQNLTTTARKVFAVVPVGEAWSSQSIYGELIRSGKRLDFALVEGCLNSLVSDGLVKEVHRGLFQRTAISRTPEPTDPCGNDDPQGEPLTTTRPAMTPPPDDLLARMAGLSQRLRGIADEVDALALQAAEEIEQAKASANRFDRLKELLKEAVA